MQYLHANKQMYKNRKIYAIMFITPIEYFISRNQTA